MIRALFACAIGLALLGAGWPSPGPGSVADHSGGGGGGGVTFETDISDDFEVDSSADWTPRRDTYTAGGMMTIDDANDGQLKLDTTVPPTVQNGIALFDGSGAPTTRDLWAIVEYTQSTSYFGIGLRHAATYSGTLYNYAVRIENTDSIVIRNCEADATCSTIGSAHSLSDGGGQAADGDYIAAMIAGEDTGNTLEICAWYFRAASPPSTPSDPTTWGDADFCVTDNSSISLLAAYSDCGTGTVCSPSVNMAPKGEAAAGQVGLSIYGGSAASYKFESFYGGDITGL